MTPDRIQQHIFRDEVAGLTHQFAQDGESLRREDNGLPVPCQTHVALVEFERVEPQPEGYGVRHRATLGGQPPVAGRVDKQLWYCRYSARVYSRVFHLPRGWFRWRPGSH